MSTIPIIALYGGEAECGHSLYAFLRGLEADYSLLQPEQVRRRLIALDDLDSSFGHFDSGTFRGGADSRVHTCAKALRKRLETANTEFYQSVRSDLVRDAHPGTLLQWIQPSASYKDSEKTAPGFGFDWRDELVSGVFQLREPSELKVQGVPDMVPYQPTPVRHVLHLITATALAQDDVFVDLGSGLGHVPLLVTMVTGAESLGVEIQAPYVASAQECAQSLNLSRARFLLQDARDTDLSNGTVFYLYSPFKGSILTDVLSALRVESTRRSLRICSLGPCTLTIASETWLDATAPPSLGGITVFNSR